MEVETRSCVSRPASPSPGKPSTHYPGGKVSLRSHRRERRTSGEQQPAGTTDSGQAVGRRCLRPALTGLSEERWVVSIRRRKDAAGRSCCRLIGGFGGGTEAAAASLAAERRAAGRDRPADRRWRDAGGGRGSGWV